MKIALAQINYTVGDFEGNKSKIIEAIGKAKAASADLVLFGEQAISGAPAFDLLNKVAFLQLCEESLLAIAAHCEDISAIIGLPAQGMNNKTISVAALIQNTKVVRYVGKMNIDSRDELFHISPSKGVEFIKIADKKVAIVVGSDIKLDNHYGEKADLIINICNSHYSRGAIEFKHDFHRQKAFMAGKPIVFINNIGGQSDVIFDGSSAVFNSRGESVALLKNFEEDFAVVDMNIDLPEVKLAYQNRTVNIYKAIRLGLGDYFKKNGFSKACVALSGGIDCSVVVALAAEVLGAENVRGLLMPSEFSSDHSVDDARQLAENLGIKYDIVPITSAFETVNQSMSAVLGDTFDVTQENIQARIRGMMIMALSNKHGYITLNTSNKSEVAVGYGTIYGDSVGAISILGDLYKAEVYDLARHINRDRVIIPENTITKEPSAELRPEQKDSDSLPPYDILDAILYRMVEEGQSREEIISAGFDEGDVYRVYNLVLNSEYKRYQFCPIFRLSAKTFGVARIMPLTNRYGN